jgi:hypothetical protein
MRSATIPPLPADLLAACAAGAPSPAEVRALRRALADCAPGAPLRLAGFEALGLPALPPALAGQPAADGGRAWLVQGAANGWRREAAVRVLDPPGSAWELAALLHRLNDWVPEVRRAAEVRLAALAPVIAPGLVAAVALALILKIEGFARLSPAGRALWRDLLARDAVRAALVERLLVAQGAGVQRAALRLWRDPGLEGALPALARGAAHPGLRARALTAVLAGAVVWHAGWRLDKATQAPRPDWRRRPLAVPVDPLPLARAALGDRAAQVRKALAEGLATLDPAEARPLAQALAGDRNGAVRLRARFFLERGAR